MIKRPLFIFTVMASIVVIILFRVKYEVSALEGVQKRLEHEINQSLESIHVLKAEWNHLNDPHRLQKLCAKYLPYLEPIRSTQLITMEDMVQADIPSNSDKKLGDYMNNIIADELELQGNDHT